MPQIAMVGQRKVRGITYLDNGQKYEGWVPKAHYTMEGECTVQVSCFGMEPHPMAAWKITHPKEGTWYIAPRSVLLHESKSQ